MARTGRPKKERSRNIIEKFAVNEKEDKELREFTMITRMNKSEFIRAAITEKIDRERVARGLRKYDDDDYYYDYEEEFDEYDDYID